MKNFFCFIFMILSLLLYSCENFFKGTELKEDLEKAIEYAAASESLVRIVPEKPDMGTVLSSVEFKVKKTDTFEISFEPSGNYYFDRWQVIDKKTQNPVEDVLKIETPSALTTKVTVLQNGHELLLKPVCKEYLLITKKIPSNSDSSYPKDSSIIITFNKTIENEITQDDFFYSAEDFLKEGWLVKEYYEWGDFYIHPNYDMNFEPLYVKSSENDNYYYFDYAAAKYYGYKLDGQTFIIRNSNRR